MFSHCAIWQCDINHAGSELYDRQILIRIRITWPPQQLSIYYRSSTCSLLKPCSQCVYENKKMKNINFTLFIKTHIQKHQDNTTSKAGNTLHILIALTSTTRAKQKETILGTYKSILEYASTIWSLVASITNINKLQILQNIVLRMATGCTPDPNTQLLYNKTHILHIQEYPQLNASEIRQKSQLHTQIPQQQNLNKVANTTSPNIHHTE